jgi:hypothetical protein
MEEPQTNAKDAYVCATQPNLRGTQCAGDKQTSGYLSKKEPQRMANRAHLCATRWLLFTGLYLFVLPCATKWRSGGRTD